MKILKIITKVGEEEIAKYVIPIGEKYIPVYFPEDPTIEEINPDSIVSKQTVNFKENGEIKLEKFK